MDDHSLEYYEYSEFCRLGFEQKHIEIDQNIDPGPPSSSPGVPPIFRFGDRWCIIVQNTLKFVSRGA
jgi:hypothetical protein